jgi:hypothetical protein
MFSWIFPFRSIFPQIQASNDLTLRCFSGWSRVRKVQLYLKFHLMPVTIQPVLGAFNGSELPSMPRRLLDRCNPDSIREYRAAARQRFDDALELAGHGRRTGAIYFWGYTAEMVLKAAYFSLIGLPQTHQLNWGMHLRPAIHRGRALGIAWPHQGEGHNVRAWAELLVVVRALSPATIFAAPFALEVQRRGQRIEQLWRETLRYRKNYAYLYEMSHVREAAEWFLVHSAGL